MTPFSNFKNIKRTFLFKTIYPKGFGSLTGKPHLGVDYITAVGTPVYAWADNLQVIKSFKANEGGNTAWVKIAGHPELVRILHLRELPQIGTYNTGSVFAFTGNTGVSTAPHAHIDVSKNGVLELNNINNFIDPDKYFESFNEEDMKVVDKLAAQFKVLLKKDPGDNMNENEQTEFAEAIKSLREEVNQNASNNVTLVNDYNSYVIETNKEKELLRKEIEGLKSLVGQEAQNTSFMTALKFLVKSIKTW